MASGDTVVVNSRAEIDTRAPFRSVKEAVSLFGERVLVGEVYGEKVNKKTHKNKIDENEQGSLKVGYMTAELEETKQRLVKAREDTIVMSNCLSSLQEELERTKRELEYLKLERESEKQMMEFDIEDLKFVEHPPKAPMRAENEEFQKKRYVAFANAPLSQVVTGPEKKGHFLERNPSLKKKKKQPLIPLLGGMFSKKNRSSQVVSD